MSKKIQFGSSLLVIRATPRLLPALPDSSEGLSHSQIEGDIELWTKWQLDTGRDQPGPHVAPSSEEPAERSSLLSRRETLFLPLSPT